MIIDSRRETAGTVERETRLYIASLNLPAASLGPIVGSRWAGENSLHWVMDMVFRDDQCRVRTDNAPANFTTSRTRKSLPRAFSTKPNGRGDVPPR